MQAELSDLEGLLQIQDIDVQIMQLKKQRAQLPQRIEVVKVRKKRAEIAPKLDQVLSLQQAKEKQITVVQDEDRSMAERQERCQADIDASGSDYRAIESHSRDMDGIVKRRLTLEENLNSLNAELAKITDVRQQVEAALAACDSQEATLKAAYKEQDDDLIDQIRALQASRQKIATSLDAALVKLYEDTAKKTGGVALAVLQQGKCGACRTVIEGGRLISLKAQAPLGSCPHCKRLLIIGDEA